MRPHLRVAAVFAVSSFALACSSGDSTEPSAISAQAVTTHAYRVDAVPSLVANGTSAAYAINDLGVVAGAAQTKSSTGHAIRWTPGSTPTDLGTFSGGTTSSATGINASGDVVGLAAVSTVASHAFVWHSPGPMKDLGHLAFGGLDPRTQTVGPTGINASGVIAGVSPLQLGAPSYNEYSRGFRYANGVMTDLGSQNATSSVALAINDNGVIAGQSATDTSAGDAFLWTPAMRNLGRCPGSSIATAVGINARGDVAGSCFTPALNGYGGHPAFTDVFLWTQAGGIHDLGSIGDRHAAVFGIGADDTIVGMLVVPTGRAAFVAYPGSGPVDLNTVVSAAGWHFLDARAVNARGQIVGNGTLNGVARGFVLTPL